MAISAVHSPVHTLVIPNRFSGEESAVLLPKIKNADSSPLNPIRTDRPSSGFQLERTRLARDRGLVSRPSTWAKVGDLLAWLKNRLWRIACRCSRLTRHFFKFLARPTNA